MRSRCGLLVDVPVRRAPTGHLLIDVGIGEEAPRPFLLDTAASGSVVSPAALPAAAGGRIEPLPAGGIHGAGGAVEGRRILGERLALGAWRSPEVALTLLDLGALEANLGAPFDGILGLDVLAAGELWLDLPAGRLALSAGREATAAARQDPGRFLAQPFRRAPLIQVDVEIGQGLAATAVLDLGAAASLINGAAARRMAVAGEGAETARRATALGADRRGVPVAPHRLPGVRFGGAWLPPLAAYAAELPVFATLGLGDTPAMLLGLDFLAGRALGISFLDHVLYVSKTTP